MNMEASNEGLKSADAPDDFKPEFDEVENNYVSFCTEKWVIDAPDENKIYANWAATADYACEFVYNNRAIRRDSVVNKSRVRQCGDSWIWRYVHGDL